MAPLSMSIPTDVLPPSRATLRSRSTPLRAPPEGCVGPAPGRTGRPPSGRRAAVASTALPVDVPRRLDLYLRAHHGLAPDARVDPEHRPRPALRPGADHGPGRHPH